MIYLECTPLLNIQALKGTIITRLGLPGIRLKTDFSEFSRRLFFSGGFS